MFKDKQFERIKFEIDLLDDTQKRNPFFYNILGIIEATKKNYVDAKIYFNFAIDLDKYYAILPSISFCFEEQDYLRHHKAKKVPFGFRYNSGTNTEWETIDSLIKKIEANIGLL